MLERFKRVTNAFNYVYEKELSVGDKIIIKMPPITPNARSINDIAYMKPSGVNLYGTIAENVGRDDTPWILISDGHDINKCVNALKIEVGEDFQNGEKIYIRVSMN